MRTCVRELLGLAMLANLPFCAGRYTGRLCKAMNGLELGSGFFDHFVPNAFGLENQFDEFACRAFPAGSLSSEMGRAFHFRSGVSNRSGQPYPAHYGQVRQIVPEKRDLRFLRAGSAQDVFVRSDLVTLLLVDEFDVQLLAPASQGSARAPGDYA